MKPFSTEAVKLIEEVFPQDTNSYGTLFGGRLMALMDKAAGIVASKFAHRELQRNTQTRIISLHSSRKRDGNHHLK